MKIKKPSQLKIPGSAEVPFWKKKSLSMMTPEEWESLCDGCGKCCLVKLEDEETGKVFYTDVCCHLLDSSTCRCKSYHTRISEVPTCVTLNCKRLNEFKWLPRSCAYRLIHEGKDLPTWHHLVSGSREEIHKRGYSVRGKVISENSIDFAEIMNHIKLWPHCA